MKVFNIILTYAKKDSMISVQFEYLVEAKSYEEAVGQVQTEADRIIEKKGGTVISII